jgi:mRNA-degrading endonuclease RelE of RelBE toxin-antitoxin system
MSEEINPSSGTPEQTGESGQNIEVFQTGVFEKAFDRLSEKEKVQVDDQIDLIVQDPEIGEQKVRDLSHIRIHKFHMDGKNMLLGYNWREGKLTICLLMLGTHENFYGNAKNRRTADKKFIKLVN